MSALFGTHWYGAHIVYFAQSIPASVFPDVMRPLDSKRENSLKSKITMPLVGQNQCDKIELFLKGLFNNFSFNCNRKY